MSDAPSDLRHKTALVRKEVSRPVRLAIRDGVLRTEHSVFDYGCGRGGDVRRLRKLGYRVSGWDPVHAPRVPVTPSEVVNLGYVVNVIEDLEERSATLQRAWETATELLIVSARLTHDKRRCQETAEFEDGLLTGTGTFQKFFSQQELSTWIAESLGVHGVPAAPGVIYVFRKDTEKERFLVRRYGRRLNQPLQLVSYERFESNRMLLKPLSDFYELRGRLPQPEELTEAVELSEVFGSIPMAFDVIRRATDAEAWKAIALARRDDLLVYLSLSRLAGRPALSKLPDELQLDIRAHFGAYTRACKEADQLLFSAGDKDLVSSACRDSPVGKQTPTALYVHVDAVCLLPPILRVYEGCTRSFLGTVEDANILKLHRVKAQISYLAYPSFEKEPHPAAFDTIVANLDEFRIFYRKYADSTNPPILHRKEDFVAPDHPLREKFARLTAQEETHGLYEETDKIGFRTHWEDLLHSKGLRLKGHRLCSIKT